MQGLLDIWNDWKQKTQGYGESIQNKYGGSGVLDFAGGVAQDVSTKSKNYVLGDEKQRGPETYRGNSQAWSDIKKTGKKIYEGMPGGDLDTKFAIKQAQKQKDTAAKTPNTVYQDKITQGGTGVKQAEDLSFMHKLSNMAGVDFDKAAATWKDKGGFEGLMANPAFTMGLAFMQAGAEGKTLGQGSLDNVINAAGISSHYKKIIEGRKQEPIQATAADIDEVKTMLDRVKLKEPNIWEKAVGWIKGDNVTAKYDRAAEAVAVAYQEEIANMQRKHKGTKPFVIDDTVKEKALLKVLKDKRVKQKDGWAIFGPFTSGTIQKDTTLPKFKARGGPVQAGKPYVVGEEGPEIIIPRSDGNVLSNDDSQIYAMLLASNPQLQKVSRARAEKILRARFPEYFE